MSGLAAVRPQFRALAVAIVPEADRLDETGWADVERIVDDALARRPAAIRRQILLFIRALNLLPLLRWGRTFRRLDPGLRARFLRGLQDAPVLLLRRGFWGVRTLVFMGYYARPDGYAQVGYDARLRGWLEHPAAPPAARSAAAAERDRTASRVAGPDAAPGDGLPGRPPGPVA